VEALWLDDLGEFLRIPSVSADPARAEDVERAAEWVRDFVRRAGGEAELVTEGGRPLAVGELRASHDAGAAPTVLVYGHFDVQPAAPLDEWESDPFELSIRDGWVYARGIADDKGQLYLLLRAAADLAAERALPVNVRVACDGEEEVAGQSIVDYLEEDDRGADACVVFDASMVRRGVPAFHVGTRGTIGLVVDVRTGARDLHSGIYGGVAMNAIHALVQALAPLFPREGRLPEPLRAGLLAPSEEELAEWRALPPASEELETVGAIPLDERAAEEFYVRTWAEPSLDLNGILGGKPEFRNTTIPAHARARLTIRIVPGQDPVAVRDAAVSLLRESLPPGAELEVETDSTTRAGLVPADAPAIQLGLDAFESALGVRPLLVRSGGSIPVVPALVDRGIPTIMTGFSLPESNIHSPNERLLAEYVPLGIGAARELYVSLAGLR
jgi:acetylornithine deacetylase/succinyl-diaminopimelate desuccinylase-like protein